MAERRNRYRNGTSWRRAQFFRATYVSLWMEQDWIWRVAPSD